MFKTTDYNPNGGMTTPKIMSPGTQLCRIINISLEKPSYDVNQYSIVLTLEGVKEGESFVGIAKDKNNPSLGNYEGQLGFVKNGQYAFSTYTYDGKTITRDDQMFRWINTLATQLGVFEKMNADGISGETIEDYIDNVKPYLINPELWGYFTIGGKEYFTAGYTNPNYGMFFPKMKDKKYPYALDLTKVLEFNSEAHIIKAAKGPEVEPVMDNTPVTNFTVSETISDDLPF